VHVLLCVRVRRLVCVRRLVAACNTALDRLDAQLSEALMKLEPIVVCALCEARAPCARL
jgi:hypothetical protein